MTVITPPPRPSIAETDALPAQIEVEVSGIARAALAEIGRTEDIRFSPSNNRLAIAGYGHSSCFVLDIVIDRREARPVVRVNDYLEVRSPEGLKAPHGFDFIDEDTLVVANRDGLVTLFDLSGRQQGERVMTLSPSRTLSRAGLFQSVRNPGSVCVVEASADEAEILVCHNYRNRVSSHRFSRRSGGRPARSRMAIAQGLLIPDGITVSPDKRWVAVSNHLTRCVMLYDRNERLDEKTSPIGRAYGTAFPHGLRFSPDGRRLVVADAGAPRVALYESADGNWEGEHDPVALYRVLDEETFLRGRPNPQEGGPKGLDIDATGTIMAMTCEEQALAFFHLPELI
jgi:hypothetical protein